MIIQPNTTVKLLQNVPLDNTYEHSIIFGSASAQESYFSGLAKHSLTGLTYQRLVPGTMRVGIKAEELYNCNYMMYQNTSFGTKWFYAFIQSVEYVNNECSEIKFEIDVIQTWLFDCNPGTAYIDRCHTATDVIGEHIEPEPVDIGEYVFNSYQRVPQLASLSVVIAIVDTEGEAVAGNVYDNVYSGATLWGFSSTNVHGINTKIAEYIQKPDSIVAMYMIPTVFIGGADGEELPESVNSIQVHFDKPGTGSALNGYVPKNKKLYTYPYTFLYVDNGSGNSLSLRYEFFGDNPYLNITGTMTQPVSAVLYPGTYKTAVAYKGESLTISNFPMCSWNSNYYQSWVAQNTVPLALSALTGLAGSAVSNGAGIAQGNAASIAGFGMNVIGTAASVASQWYSASIHNDISKGNANNGNVLCSFSSNTFNYGKVSATAQYLKMADDFFTRFGYHIGKIQTVNRSARPHWTYLKTIGIDMRGSVPAEDMRKITQAYDKGITWWKSGAEVGNFGLDNSV